MDMSTTFNNVAIKVGDPVHDDEGNVIGNVKSWNLLEDGKIEALWHITDADVVLEVLLGKQRAFRVVSGG